MSHHTNKGVEVEHDGPSSDYWSFMYTINRNQGTECNPTSVNRCVEFEHLKGSINQGILMYSQNCRWRENLPLMTVSLKELKWTLDSYSRIDDLKSMEWNRLEGGH